MFVLLIISKCKTDAGCIWVDGLYISLLLESLNTYTIPAVHKRQHRLRIAMCAVGAALAQRGLTKASTAVQAKQIQRLLGTAKA